MITETDTCRKYVLPGLYEAGWTDDQISQEKYFTDGRVVPVGRGHVRKPGKRADYLLRYRPDTPIAVVEAKAAPLAPLDSVRVPAPERPRLERAVEAASVDAFHLAMGVATGLVGLGGVLAAIGIVNPRRRVTAEDCSGGQLAGAPLEAADPAPGREPAAA